MLFTIINFMRLFALVLFFTIVQATIGSFVVFLALTDCIGPSNPTYAVDFAMSKLKACLQGKKKAETRPRQEGKGAAVEGDFEA